MESVWKWRGVTHAFVILVLTDSFAPKRSMNALVWFVKMVEFVLIKLAILNATALKLFTVKHKNKHKALPHVFLIILSKKDIL